MSPFFLKNVVILALCSTNQPYLSYEASVVGCRFFCSFCTSQKAMSPTHKQNFIRNMYIKIDSTLQQCHGTDKDEIRHFLEFVECHVFQRTYVLLATKKTLSKLTMQCNLSSSHGCWMLWMKVDQ
jgi:hypothetical protein